MRFILKLKKKCKTVLLLVNTIYNALRELNFFYKKVTANTKNYLKLTLHSYVCPFFAFRDASRQILFRMMTDDYLIYVKSHSIIMKLEIWLN